MRIASEIKRLIHEAEQSGHPVWFDDECCGCDRGVSLNIGRLDEDIIELVRSKTGASPQDLIRNPFDEE